MRNEGFVLAVLNACRFSEILRLWIAIAIVAAVDLIWLRANGMTMAIDPTQAIAFCAAALLSFVYTRLRPDRRIAELATALTQIIAFTVVGAILSYLTVTAKFPLVDSQLAGVRGLPHRGRDDDADDCVEILENRGARIRAARDRLEVARRQA